MNKTARFWIGVDTAIYRLERIIQDISDYCEYIFLSDESGDDRMQFMRLYFTGGASGSGKTSC